MFIRTYFPSFLPLRLFKSEIVLPAVIVLVIIALDIVSLKKSIFSYRLTLLASYTQVCLL